MVVQEFEIQVGSKTISAADLNQKLDAAGWGLFFLWVGIALLLDVGWGVGLLGVGIITLGEQAVRRYLGIGLDGFWVMVGLIFLVGGMWELAKIQISMLPFLIILAGVAIFASAFRKRR